MKLKHIALIGSLFPILFSLVLFFGVLISADSDDENSNFSSGITGMNLSAEVLKHQPMVEKYARENGISEYVNVLLAIIQVESGGTAEDVMQSSESLGLPPNSLDTENSIKQGCKYFASLLSSCKNQGIDDLNVAIQSYNYGGGYVGYVAGKGKKHTFNLAESFAREKSGGKKVTYTNPIAVGVYKNFTAIDQHTTHEKEIIELRLQDTNGIENFVKNFAKSYYTWNNSKEAIEARTQAINGYLTKELQDLNVDTIRTDIPTSSTVTDVIVWSIEQSGTDTFSATYEVDQQIKEGEQTSNVKATYTVKVYVDADGDMVIVQNPTLAPAIEKSDYEPKTPEADASVDADTVNDATAFLETFFKLYPTATEKELAYYVLGNVIEPIGRDYLYSELVNPIFIKDGDNVKVKVAVKFIDNQTKATQVSQYELVLHKDSNWKIVG